MGLSFEEDSRFATLMMRVMKITVLMMIVYLIQFIVDFLSGSLDAVLNLIVPLSVIYCGYVGAKQRNKPLLCCFCGCSLALGILGLMVIAALFVSFFSVGQYEYCHHANDPDQTVSSHCVCVDIHNNTKELPYLTNDQFEKDCDLAAAKHQLHIFFGFSLVIAILNLCAFYNGKALHDQPYFTAELDHQQAIIGMQVKPATFLSFLVMLRHKCFASDPNVFIWFSPLCSVDCVSSATAATAGHGASSACEQPGWATDGASSPGKTFHMAGKNWC
jgi:hypothetical protein